MKDGFIRVAAVTPKIKVADPEYNAQQIIELINQGYSRGVKLMVFPELCLTAYTCSDLFFQSSLLLKAREELARIISATKDKDILVFVGMPWEREGKLFNVAAVIQGGKLLGISAQEASSPTMRNFTRRATSVPAMNARCLWHGRTDRSPWARTCCSGAAA